MKLRVSLRAYLIILLRNRHHLHLLTEPVTILHYRLEKIPVDNPIHKHRASKLFVTWSLLPLIINYLQRALLLTRFCSQAKPPGQEREEPALCGYFLNFNDAM